MRARRPLLSVVAIMLLAFNLRLAVSGVPPILGDLGLGTVAQSLLVTLPVLCFGMAALSAPWLTRQVGEDQLLLGVIAALAVGLAVRAAWPASGLFPGTLVAALAVAIMNVLVPGVVRGRFAGHSAAMTSAYTVALSLGAGLAAGLTVPILHATRSLHLALGVWAIPAGLAGLVWAAQLGGSRPARGHDSVSGPRITGAGVQLWSSPIAWGVTAFFGMQSLVYYAVLSWLPSIYRSRGDSASAAGLLLAILAIVGILGNLLGPALASRTKDQRLAVTAGVSTTAIGLLGVLLGPPSWAILWVCILGIGTGATFSVALLLLVVRSDSARTAVSLSAMAQGTGYLIAASGPLALGLVRAESGSWTWPLVLLLAVLTLETVPGLIGARDKPVGSLPAGPGK